MKYSEARPLIQSGDVLLWSYRGGWNSWHNIKLQLVRIWTRSDLVHVGVAWVVGGRVMVVEAVSTGVRIFPLSRLLPFYWINTGCWNDEIEQEALKHVGDKYSYWDAIKGGLGLLAIGRDSCWQCAEFVQHLLWPKYVFPEATPAETGYTLITKYGKGFVWVSE